MSNMSRMERRRQEELEKQKKDQAHRKKDTRTDKESKIDERIQNSESPRTTPLKPFKKKKKSTWLKKVLIFFVVLLGLSALGYAKGVWEAKRDSDNHPIEVGLFKGQASKDGSVNILLLGSDSRGADQGRSDSIMIAHYNKKNKQPKIVSIMRDTFVGIPLDSGLEYNKINAAYAYGGPELVRQTIELNFNVPINYYAIVNFDSFPKIIDILAPRGLAIDAEKDLEVEGTFIKKGPQKMNGNEALQYARFRKDEEGDFGRVRRQQQVMAALVKQAMNPLNTWRLPEAVGAVSGYTQTDIPFSFYPKIGSNYVFSRHKPLEIMTIPVANSWSDGYYDYAGSVLEIDQQMNQEAIHSFFSK